MLRREIVFYQLNKINCMLRLYHNKYYDSFDMLFAVFKLQLEC